MLSLSRDAVRMNSGIGGVIGLPLAAGETLLLLFGVLMTDFSLLVPISVPV